MHNKVRDFLSPLCYTSIMIEIITMSEFQLLISFALGAIAGYLWAHLGWS